jgi:hypothetical protein
VIGFSRGGYAPGQAAGIAKVPRTGGVKSRNHAAVTVKNPTANGTRGVTSALVTSVAFVSQCYW